MLRAKRSALIKRSRIAQLPAVQILACTCRFASTATLSVPTSSSAPPVPSSPYPSSSRSSYKRTALYAAPTLPPLPPPLPAYAEAEQALYAPASKATTGAGALAEQWAVLTACLSTGDITRAEEIVARMMANFNVNASPTGYAALLPPAIHADFLRSYLSSALVAPPPKSMLKTLWIETDRSNSVQRARLVTKAWAYFDLLLQSTWRPSGSESSLALDASVFAVMLKGLVAGGEKVYDPSEVTGMYPITRLLDIMADNKIHLLDVMNQPVFDVTLPSYMGPVTRVQVLDVLEEVGVGRSGWARFGDEVTRCKQAIAQAAERREMTDMTSSAPELTPMHDKENNPTHSLQTLRTNLSTLGLSDATSHYPLDVRQRRLEESSYDAARQLYIHEMEELAKVGKDKERGMQSNWLQSLMFEWMDLLKARLIADGETTGKRSRWSRWGKDPDIESLMRTLAPDKMALITIVELLRICGGGGVSDGIKVTRACLHIGRAIEAEHHAEILRQGYAKNRDFLKDVAQVQDIGHSNAEGDVLKLTAGRSMDILWKKKQEELRKSNDAAFIPNWSQAQRAQVGSLLATTLLEVAKVTRTIFHNGEEISEEQPAFSHTLQYVRGKKLGVVRLNMAIAERMDQDPLRITLHPRFLPMIVPPKPWYTYNSGGYLIHDMPMMRTKDSAEQIRYLDQACKGDKLEKVFSGLDVLGGLAWKINRPIFDVITEVWNTGEPFADIPGKVPLSSPIDVLQTDNISVDPRAKDNYRNLIRKAVHDRRNAHSMRCDTNYKLEIARAFLEETFYFPHNLDFRGRAYPIPPNLSHIGNDLCRGLLMFDEAKPLGERGLRWLKIHLANMAGYDKASFDEREAFAMEHLDDVYDSADKPLDGKRWWLKADDPWQCLATCKDLAAALRSHNPEEYLSSLPVHQDGTCNGLQHYAALGGDLAGANQVNLEGGDRPSDVYSGVAAMVNAVVDADAAKGHELALLLQGKVTRKVVKQTVMTTVYGVTFVGAKRQIEKQLKERGDIPFDKLYSSSLYLGRIVLNSIGSIFSGASSIQIWLNRCARLIAKSIPGPRLDSAVQMDRVKSRGKTHVRTRIAQEQMTSVAWTTPLGLPVVQPYRKQKKRQVMTALQTVFITDPRLPAEVDARAQATAFPPNFIHSLDATHMMMTALMCKDTIAFASVHDSYWTHAASVDELSVNLREAFIELHSQDILGKLRQEFIDRYTGHVVPVSKVPAGMKYSFSNHGAIQKSTSPGARSSSQVENEIFAALEKEDNDRVAPLFETDVRTPRAGRNEAPEAAESDSNESELDDFLRPANESKSGASKFVQLRDILPPVPARGSFDLSRIRDSLYFFS